MKPVADWWWAHKPGRKPASRALMLLAVTLATPTRQEDTR